MWAGQPITDAWHPLLQGYNVDRQCEPPHGLTNVAQVAPGNQHTCARKNDGSVVCWGASALVARARQCLWEPCSTVFEPLQSVCGGAARLLDDGLMVLLAESMDAPQATTPKDSPRCPLG